jgi:endonuclease/exonuclease/phosphatase family metal-dependent hydrolase
MELTLVTINTWKCEERYHQRKQLLRDGLKESGAQLILCQECFRTVDGSVDTLEYLSRELALSAWFIPCRRKRRILQGASLDSWSGLGVLTGLPVLKQAFIDLPSNVLDGGRRAQLVTIEVKPGILLLVANIHLTHLPDEALRKRQLRAVVEEMQQSDAAIRIIGGDWNTGTGSVLLTELMAKAPAADCYVLGGGEEPRASLLSPWLNGVCYCVDHFISLSGTTAFPSFIRAGVVLNHPDPCMSNIYPSDHFGIRVTLVVD